VPPGLSDQLGSLRARDLVEAAEVLDDQAPVTRSDDADIPEVTQSLRRFAHPHEYASAGYSRIVPCSRSRSLDIIRLIGDCFGGTGAERVLALIRHPAVLECCARALARTGATSPLAVTVTAGLFEELRAEGLPDHGWEPVPSAGAWLRPFDAAPAAAAP
jgi:hypothetical protein